MKILWKDLYKLFDQNRQILGLSWRMVATEAQVTPSAFTRLKSGKAVSLKTLLKILRPLRLDEQIPWLYNFAKVKQ